MAFIPAALFHLLFADGLCNQLLYDPVPQYDDADNGDSPDQRLCGTGGKGDLLKRGAFESAVYDYRQYPQKIHGGTAGAKNRNGGGEDHGGRFFCKNPIEQRF